MKTASPRQRFPHHPTGRGPWGALAALLVFAAAALLAHAAPVRAAEAYAADLSDADPSSFANIGLPRAGIPWLASITPHGAAVQVRQELPIESDRGRAVVRLLLPHSAENGSYSITGMTVGGVFVRTVTLPESPVRSPQRSALQADRRRLTAELMALRLRLKQAENVSPQLASAEDARKLCLEIVQTEDSLKSVDQKLSILPARERKWKLVTLRISEGKPAATAKVEYSYVLPGCRWQPVYTVSCDPSAEPGKDRKTWINVRLEAEITQPSGLDWPGTHLSLVLGGSGYAELPALDSWVIGENGSRPAGMPRARLMMAAAPEAASADGNAVSAMDGSGTYTVWTPPLTGLAAGMNRVTLDHADWQEQLVWTARPLNSDTSVYLCAEHQLTEREHAWPAGRASMIADDVHVGDMTFSPRAGSVFLSFGRDPRVSLEARTEPRRSGQQGLIGKKKVWEWEWTYTVRSALEREALVRVERPLPLSTYKGCEVQFTTVPQAAEDRTEKKLTWEFALPAGAEKSLKHTVRVTAPEDARIAPVAP